MERAAAADEALLELGEEAAPEALDPATGDVDELAADEAAPAVPLTTLVADRGAEVTVWVIEAGALVRCETVPPTAGAVDFTVETAPPTACDTAEGVETDGVDTDGTDTWGVVATGVVTEGTVTEGVLTEGSVTAPLDRDSTPSTHRSSSASRLPQ